MARHRRKDRKQGHNKPEQKDNFPMRPEPGAESWTSGEVREIELAAQQGGEVAPEDLELTEREIEAASRLEENRPRAERKGFLGFLRGVWAELRRVQWPNRQQIIQATAVVVGFVIIVGSYLGLLDFVFSRLVNAIL